MQHGWVYGTWEEMKLRGQWGLVGTKTFRLGTISKPLIGSSQKETYLTAPSLTMPCVCSA